MSNQIDGETAGLVGNEYNEDTVRAFVGKNADYYIKKWKKAKNPARKAGWNWAAFFLSLFWLGYRRMYSILLGILGLFLVIDIIQFFVTVDLSKYAGIAVSATIGAGGNAYYYQKMDKSIKEIQKSTDNNDQIIEKLRSAGGAGWKGVGIAVALFVAYAIATTLLTVVHDMLLGQ